jgi:feruloyl-CoA synthase
MYAPVTWACPRRVWSSSWRTATARPRCDTAGPNITPGYWRNEADTAAALRRRRVTSGPGDAVKWIDETDVHRGLKFDGRIAEDFKLATGTFVSVGPLRGRIIAVRRTLYPGRGADRQQPATKSAPWCFRHPRCRDLGGLADDAPLADVLAIARRAWRISRPCSTRSPPPAPAAPTASPACACCPSRPRSTSGEITDKGSINQRAVLTHRAGTVAALHADTLPGMLKPAH